MDDTEKFFADKLHISARDVGLSRKKIAEKMQVSERTVSYWWAGETSPNAIQLKLYSEITGKNIMWFYGEDYEATTQKITIPREDYDQINAISITEKTRSEQLEKLYNQLLSKITEEK